MVVAGLRLVVLLLLAPFAELALLGVVDEVLDLLHLLLLLCWVLSLILNTSGGWC